jgi:hypothetical protein
MQMRALLFMLVASVGIACESDVKEDEPVCTPEAECNLQSRLCINSCSHPSALRSCLECCKQEYLNCNDCKPWNVKHCW